MCRVILLGLVLPALLAAQAPDPGRPVLKRGGPAVKREPVERPEGRIDRPPVRVVEVDEDGRAETIVRDKPLTPAEELLERARQEAAAFSDSLPNFICDQHVVRYKGEGLRPTWKKQDTLDVEVVFFDRKEQYQNIRRNGRPLRKGSPEDSGTWSMGEFGTVLLDIMAGNTNARFTPREKPSEFNGVQAQVFNFTVGRDGAHWEIRMGTPVRPPYQGAIWVDPESARVLRIEMDTRQLPKDYAVDQVEMTIDYGWVEIGGRRHLLPTRSENLSCLSVICTKNEIEFRNYRQFSVESQVLQVESEITFEEEGKPAKKPVYVPPSLDPKKKP